MIVAFCLMFLAIITESISKDSSNAKDADDLDYSKFLVWGPGLRADFFMPVRYFYIQTVDKNSNKYK